MHIHIWYISLHYGVSIHALLTSRAISAEKRIYNRNEWKKVNIEIDSHNIHINICDYVWVHSQMVVVVSASVGTPTIYHTYVE